MFSKIHGDTVGAVVFWVHVWAQAAHGPGTRPHYGPGRRCYGTHGHRVAANATERAVRGETRTPMKDGIYRAAQRGMSTRQMQEARALAERSADSMRRLARGTETLQQTRAMVVSGWTAIARQLTESGNRGLAVLVNRFVEQMPSPKTDQVQRTTSCRVSSTRLGQEA